MDENEDRRAKMDRLRRWEAEQRQAQETQALQRAAAQRKGRSTARRVVVSRLGMVLVGLGVLVGLTHMLRHLAYSPQGVEDITAGYPAAAVLVVLGLVLLGTP